MNNQIDANGPIPDQMLRGVHIFTDFLNEKLQERMVEQIREIAVQAPFYQPMTPGGRRMGVRMTSAGEFGWFSDGKGYRYVEKHPNGMDWPKIPSSAMGVWRQITGSPREPQCCLVNYYSEQTKMGMHQDKDEKDFQFPVVSISLGDPALFRIGNLERGGKTQSIWLRSGDVAVLGGEARLLHHGIDRIKFGQSGLLKNGGRLNLTLRVVT